MNLKSILLIGGGALLLAALMLPGQDGRQEWTLSRDNGSTVRFQIERWKPGSHMSMSTDLPRDRFRGLPASPSGAVKFEYVQDAGRLICEGSFSFGRGSGKFTFAPNPDFIGALTRLGYDAPAENQLFDLMIHGVNIDLAQAAKDANLRASVQQLIEMRTHGVDAAYIKDVREAGFQPTGAHDLVQMKIHGVSPSFLADLTAAGYDIPVERVVELRIHGVDSRYLRDIKSYGLKPEPKDLVQFKIHGVNPEFLRDAKELGYEFAPQELVNLKIHGVDGRYLRRLRDSGMKNLTAEQIQKLKLHGID